MYFFINDLLKNEGGFLSLEQFQNNFGILSNYLEYNGLLKAIPMKYFKAYKAFLQDDVRKT